MKILQSRSRLAGGRQAFGDVIRFIADLDSMRAHDLPLVDLLCATRDDSMNVSPEEEQLRQASGGSQTLEYVRGSYVVSVVTRDFKPEQYGNIVLKASPDGEILRLKDVATIQSRASILTPGGGTRTTGNFVRIGHSLVALIVGWLGGGLSRKFWPSHLKRE